MAFKGCKVVQIFYEKIMLSKFLYIYISIFFI